MSAKFNSVLLIDDNAITNTLHETLLDASGIASNVVVFESGVEAITYLKNDEQNRIPEIIFLDINMPVMDGFGFLTEFNKLPADLTAKTKIIMLSSSLDETDRVKSKACTQVIDFIVKPLTLAALRNIAI